MIDFRTLQKSSSPNTFLACTGSHCPAAKSDISAPLVAAPVEAVMALWDAVIAAAPRVEETARSGDGTQREYIQRSKTFGFPDHIAVRFIAEDAAGKPATRVLMFSAAQKGYYDFGVNRRRVTTWLETLCRKAAAAAAEKTGP